MPDTFIWNQRKLIVSLAARYHLPAIYPFRDFAEEGLICYGVDPGDLLVRTATYVDKILKGAKPADLPVQLPTKSSSSRTRTQAGRQRENDYALQVSF
jgi:putative ABC transport system substrate-binding protein